MSGFCPYSTFKLLISLSRSLQHQRSRQLPHCLIKYSQRCSCGQSMIGSDVLSLSRGAEGSLCRRFTNFLRSVLCAAVFQANYLSVLLRSLQGLSCQRDIQRRIHGIEQFSLFKGLLEQTRTSDCLAPNTILLSFKFAEAAVAHALGVCQSDKIR